jgi:hypothetical protein
MVLGIFNIGHGSIETVAFLFVVSAVVTVRNGDESPYYKRRRL